MSGKSTLQKRRGRPPKKGRLSLDRRQRLERERRKKEKGCQDGADSGENK